MQGTWVWALVQEDPTCGGATKPVHGNYWACALGPTSHNYWAHVPQLQKPARLEPVLHKRSHRNEKPAHRNDEQPPLEQLEKARAQQRRPNAAKNKIKKKFFFKEFYKVKEQDQTVEVFAPHEPEKGLFIMHAFSK